MEVAKFILKFFLTTHPLPISHLISDLFDVIVNAVNTVIARPVITLKNTYIPNLKNPCGICLKSVNKNQKACFLQCLF